MSNGTDGDRPLIGGRYEIGELLGRGGMAEVRKGNDRRLGRIVGTPPYKSMTIRSWQTTLALRDLMRERA